MDKLVYIVDLGMHSCAHPLVYPLICARVFNSSSLRLEKLVLGLRVEHVVSASAICID